MDKKQQFEQKQKDSSGHIPSFEEIQEGEKQAPVDDIVDSASRFYSKATGQHIDIANGPDKQVELEINGETGEIVGMTEELPEMADREALLQLVEEKYQPIQAIMNLPDDKLERILDDIQADQVLRDRCAKLETYCENMIEYIEQAEIEAHKGNYPKQSVFLQTVRAAMDKYYEDYGVKRCTK